MHDDHDDVTAQQVRAATAWATYGAEEWQKHASIEDRLSLLTATLEPYTSEEEDQPMHQTDTDAHLNEMWAIHDHIMVLIRHTRLTLEDMAVAHGRAVQHIRSITQSLADLRVAAGLVECDCGECDTDDE